MIKVKQTTQNQEWKYMTREDRAKELIEKGFKVLRLWENKIKKMTLIEFSNGVLSK